MGNCTSIRKEDDDAVVAVGIEKEDSDDDSPPPARPHSSPSLISSSVPPTSGFGGDDDRQEDSPPPPSSSSSTTTSQTSTGRVGVKIERDDIDDDEYRSWLKRVRRNGELLEHAPYHIRNNKKIVLIAVQKYGLALEYASPSLQNDKEVVLAAVKQDGRALQFASPSLQNDKQVVMAAVKQRGGALQYASPSLKNDKKVVMEAVKKNAWAIEFASPELRNDKQVVMTTVKNIGDALQHASPDLQNDVEVVTAAVVMAAVTKNGSAALKFASPELQDDKRIVMAAIQSNPPKYDSPLKFASPTLQNDIDVVVAAVAKDSKAINFVSPDLLNDPNTWSALIRKNVVSPELFNDPMNWHRRDKAVILAAAEKGVVDTLDLTTQELRDDKDFALMWVKANPDNIKFINENLKRDPEIMVASGMYDSKHVDAKTRREQQQRKIVLSTRFSLNSTGTSVATTFTKLFKDHEYINTGKFVVYCPNAFDKKSCDPNWTDINWPCRGIADTTRLDACKYKNVLTKDGYPTDNCCWRYSFRNQLQEAKDTGGLILQLIERDHGETRSDAMPKLGKGQEIEFEMAKELKMKIFKVYINPNAVCVSPDYVDTVVKAIRKWYEQEADDGTCRDDMTGYLISGGYQTPMSYF